MIFRTVLILARIRLDLALFPFSNDKEPNEESEQDDQDDDGQVIEGPRQRVPAGSEIIAAVGQGKAPWQRTEEAEDHKSGEFRAAHACRQGDERSHDRQQAASEDGDVTILLEPAFRRQEVLLLQEYISPVAEDEGAPSIIAEGVGDHRPERAP